MFNDKSDLGRLRKAGTGGAGLHQLAAEFSDLSPADYTLETSRCGGKALAALAALHSLGRHGYQSQLARLVDSGRAMRDELGDQPDLNVLNADTLGFNTMVRFRTAAEQAEGTADATKAGNTYLKEFFGWDNATRMNAGGDGVVYSFSGSYRKTRDGGSVSALKFYPTSPHVTPEHMSQAARLLIERKTEFDRAGLP